MRWKLLDARHLLVVLTKEEARTLGLNGFGGARARLAAARILSVVGGGAFLAEGQHVLLRMLPAAVDRTVLLFTLQAPYRRCYRVRSRPIPLVFRVEGADAVLGLWERLPALPCASAAVQWYHLEKDRYAVVVRVSRVRHRRIALLLAEYGTYCGSGEAAAAFAAEHGRLLQKKTARIPGPSEGAV